MKNLITRMPNGKLTKIIRRCAIITFFQLSFNQNVMAESENERKLTQLTEQRNRAIAEAISPINSRYLAELKKLLQKATQSNDLDAALKIRNTIESLNQTNLGKRFVGQWKNEVSELFIYSDGYYRDTWRSGSIGKWIAKSDGEITIAFGTGNVHNYRIEKDGKSITRSQDGMTWLRVP